MHISALKIPAALAMACALSVPALAGGGDCKALGNEILNFAGTNGINRISVLDFTPKGGAEKSEADYVSEQLAARLAGRKKPLLIERSQLEKVLKEARLASASGKDRKPDGIFSVDAVVTGTVFASGEKLIVMAKLIDVGTGIVLMAGQAETERGWPQLWIPEPETRPEGPPPAAPSDFRDALSDFKPPSCEARKLRAADLNAELVDAKARHWAARMKEPGFTLRGLTRNPGTEISDPATKARFYELLARYYEADEVTPPEPWKRSALAGLLQQEDSLYNECGCR